MPRNSREKRLHQLKECQSHKGQVYCAAFGIQTGHNAVQKPGECKFEDVTYATGGEDKRVYVWKLGQPQPMYTLTAGKGATDDSVSVMKYSTHYKTVIGGCSRGALMHWRLPEAEGASPSAMRLKGHGQGITGVDYHPLGTFILSVGLDGMAKVWDISKGICLQNYRLDAAITCAAFSPHGRNVTVCLQDGQVQTFDIGSTTKPILQHNCSHRVTSFDYALNQYYFAFSTTNRKTTIYNIQGQAFSSTGYQNDAIQMVRFHPFIGEKNRRHLYTFASDALRIYSMDNPDTVMDWEEANWGNTVQDCMFLEGKSGTGDSLLAMSLRGENVAFWKMDGMNEIEKLLPPSSSQLNIKAKQQALKQGFEFLSRAPAASSGTSAAPVQQSFDARNRAQKVERNRPRLMPGPDASAEQSRRTKKEDAYEETVDHGYSDALHDPVDDSQNFSYAQIHAPLGKSSSSTRVKEKIEKNIVAPPDSGDREIFTDLGGGAKTATFGLSSPRGTNGNDQEFIKCVSDPETRRTQRKKEEEGEEEGELQSDSALVLPRIERAGGGEGALRSSHSLSPSGSSPEGPNLRRTAADRADRNGKVKGRFKGLPFAWHLSNKDEEEEEEERGEGRQEPRSASASGFSTPQIIHTGNGPVMVEATRIKSPPIDKGERLLGEARQFMDSLSNQHEPLKGILRRRISMAKLYKTSFENGNPDAIFGTLEHGDDKGTFFDLCRMLSGEPGKLVQCKLDFCIKFLKALSRAKESKYDNYQKIVYNTAGVLLEHYKDMILATRVGFKNFTSHKDVAAMERKTNCDQCITLFQDIRKHIDQAGHHQEHVELCEEFDDFFLQVG